MATSSASSSMYFDCNRRPAPPLWKEQRSTPLGDHSSPPSLSRVLPPLANSTSTSNKLQLPSLSANLRSSTSWHAGSNGANAYSSSFPALRKPQSCELRRSNQDPMLSSLSGQSDEVTGSSRSVAAGASSAGLASPSIDAKPPVGRKPAKAHVPAACFNCKRAHLACDVCRPCRRCVNLGMSDTCIDAQHKKRGRPRLKDRTSSQTGVSTLQTLEGKGKGNGSGSRASVSYAGHSPSSESGYFRSLTRNNESSSCHRRFPLSNTAAYVSRRTHDTGAHPRSASNSISPSSYPYARLQHDHQPMDASISQVAGHLTSSWSLPQSRHYAFRAFHRMTARYHSHSILYEQQYRPSYQQSQQHHRHGSLSPQQSTSLHVGASASHTSDGFTSAVATMICSTNLQCVRISEQCAALLGYQMSELDARSLFELVYPSETSRLQDIWSLLIDPMGVIPQAFPAAAEVAIARRRLFS